MKVLSVVNLGEALHVTADVDGKTVGATINSEQMLTDKERGLYDILRRLAEQPEVEEAKSEKEEIVEAPVAAYTPDAQRVAKVAAMETAAKKLVGKVDKN